MSLADFTLDELLDEAQRRINCARATYRGIILVGPPGAGKGTQAPNLQDKFCLCHISTGDALRAAVKAGTELGKKAKDIMDRGELVPDELVNGIVGEAIEKKECEKGFILDGYPRTIGQVNALDNLLKSSGKGINDVIQLKVPDNVLEERITGRLLHKPSGRTYHKKWKKPKVSGKDDITGEDLITRKDDTLEVLRPRLKQFHEWTKPVIEHYKQKGLLRVVDGNTSLKGVWQRIKAQLNIND